MLDIQSHNDYEIFKLVKKNRGVTLIFKLGELFCGPGGLACGAFSAKIENPDFRIEHAWSTDYDQDTCNTYVKNLCPNEPETVYCKDVREFADNGLMDLSPIDALAFGFPCNDFSVVGERKGLNGNFGPLYTYGVRVLKRYKPKFFIAENVGGLRSDGKGGTLKKILQDLEDAGYNLTPNYYAFEKYGVPQTRHRIIIVGMRKDLNLKFMVPSPVPYADADISVRTALTVPEIPENAANNELTKQSETVIERLKYIRPGENAFTANLPDSLKLNVKGAKISQIYKRLDPEKPSYTVTGSGGGGTHIYHWSEPRALTNRERARIQTFPDSFVFCGSKESVRRQIGMAVPCRGAQIICEAVLRTFAGINYESVEASL